jgi:hypothetical protein
VKRQAFNTGQAHQAAVARWARKRLVDRGGSLFDDETEQDTPRQLGCLFADGVGLGKTWEALATVALLLGKRDGDGQRRRSEGGQPQKQVNLRRRQAHVLVLVPPGLVAKWSNEICNSDGFQRRLAGWAQKESRRFIAKTLHPEYCFVVRRRVDLDALPRGRIKRRRYVLPAGTYVCNWNVMNGALGRGRDRIAALRNQKWDAVIVDEAHHRHARDALGRMRHASFRLLLTATPFQLDMTELHRLTKHLVKGGGYAHKVLKRGAVREFVKRTDAAFDDSTNLPPTAGERHAAQRVLGQLVACSRVGRQKRHYFAITTDGREEWIPAPTDLDKQDGITRVLQHAIAPSPAFNGWYLRQRLALARRQAGEAPKHIAVELRKVLSISNGAPSRPKLDALRAWARMQFVKDLAATLADGIPRKLLVFTHLKANIVGPIQQMLEEELVAAHNSLADRPEWKDAHVKAAVALNKLIAAIEPHMLAPRRAGNGVAWQSKFRRAIEGSLVFDLLGKRSFATRVKKELLGLVSAEKSAMPGITEGSWYNHQVRIKQSRAKAVLDAIARVPLSATFTGDDTRRERDAIADAFTTAFAPWILVATNVGSEGIDLHRYSRHLVHFDLEWNPARMEQREGRIDRLGRALKEPTRIYYLLVRDTYDERMFHQLIARQRWHGVLLGRKALQLDRDETKTARWISQRETDRMALDLDPRTSSRS